MNFENQGVPIAQIKTKKTKRPPILSIESDNTAQHSFNEYQLKGDDEFQVLPNTTSERDIIYISAQSGAGKSFWCWKYCEEYRKIFPKREIYLFSSLESDDTIDKIKGLKRIKIKNSDFLTDESLEAEDFKESLVIFDDCDCLTDKKIKVKVMGIMNNCLETGRHFKVSMLITSHLACTGNDSKRVLNEAHKIVIFAKSMGNRSLKYLLDSYLGLDKKQIKKVKNLSSRWVCICKTYPQVIISQKDAYILANSDD